LKEDSRDEPQDDFVDPHDDFVDPHGDFVDGLDVEKLYQHRFSATTKRTKAGVWQVLVRDYFQKWIPPEATVLDLGCGYGEFLNNVVAKRRIGIDFNGDAADHLEEGIEFHQGDVTDLSMLPDNSVDVVFTSNMLEHLRGKRAVERLIVESRRVLVEGGQFIAMGPNMRYLPGSYWDFWDHVVAITDRSLVEVLTYLDLEVVDCFPKFLPYTTQSRLPQAGLFVRAYLKCPLIWRVLGKQFLIRARRK
jgi:SAM-dependent methyltransferase